MNLKLDIELFCQRHKLEYAHAGQHHHAHTGWLQIHCPFCAGGHGGFHLGFNLQRGNFNCWRCGSHSLWQVVGAILRTKRNDLIGQAIAKCVSKKHAIQRQLEAKYAAKLKPIPDLRPLKRIHRDYLESRNFDAHVLAEEWDLRGTRMLSGLWNWRIVAPICESSGRVVGYVGRTIKKNVKQRYKVSDKEDCLVDPKTFLYGIEKVTTDGIVVVEGPADTWRLGPGSVATQGIVWRRQQANQLRKFKRRFILYDPEPLAQRKAAQLAEYLSLFGGHTEVITGFDTDPGDMSDEDARHLMKTLIGRRT